jgi:plastocyanin
MIARKSLAWLISLALVFFVQPPTFAQEAPISAEVEFGSEKVGSPFPPPSGHDHSGHASHKMFPRTVTIARGGSVTFEVDEIHQPAIYAPGKEPKDVVITDQTLQDLTLPCLPQTLTDFVINDPVGRVALAPPQACDESEWTTPAGTFEQPGRYLVICTTRPHFVDDQMYGWVVVK